MAPPRKSLAAARITGAMAKNPQRYRRRIEPNVATPLGPAPGWMTALQAEAWDALEARLPWLNQSHRGLVEIAATLQAVLAQGALGVPGMQLLRLCLGQLCATPVTAGKVETLAEADPDDGLFQR